MVVNEGKYDSLVTRLAGDILRFWKQGVDSGEREIQFEKYVVDDAKNLEFDLYMTLTLNDTGTWGVLPNSGANTGQDGQDPLIIGLFTVDQGDLPQMWREIAFTLRDFLRHEVEHLTQGGINLRLPKKKNVMRQQRLAINQGQKPSFKYPMLKSEIEPMLQGMYFRAKKERRPFIDVVDDWFNLQGYTRQEKETILKLWNKYIPSLNLPKLVLKEEEEDFNVEAPAEWNVETLTVGDTITPDMFKDNYRFYNFDLYIKEIGWDDEYEYDDIEGAYMVVTEFDDIEAKKKYGHNQFAWWLHELNDFLKPGYRVVQPLSESEEEDFSVEAPPEWNITELEKGDYIMPDMWVEDIDDFFPGQSESKYLFKQLTSKPIKITGVMRGDELYFEVSGLHFILTNDFLLPQYRVVGDFGMYESDDEFSVDAPAEWNVEYLSIGDQITPDMWNQESKLIWDLLDTDIDKTYKIIDFFEEWDGYEEQEDFDPIFVELEDKAGRISTESLTVLQGALKPEFKITQNKNLTESEDDEDFSVEAPPEWNVTWLSKGDIITPDMWKDNLINWNHGVRIEGFKPYDSVVDYMVYLRHLDGRTPLQIFDLGEVNDWLKDKYRVEVNDLMESDDDEDFSVEAPAEWNQHELKVGDYFNDYDEAVYTREEDIPKDSRRLTYEIIYIGPNEGEYYNPAYFNHNIITFKRIGSDNVYSFTVEHFNRTRGPKLNAYIELPDRFTLNEDEDEFSVEAPAEWNQELLTVGDTVMPDMWNDDGGGFVMTKKPLKIINIGSDDYGWFVEFEGYPAYDLEEIHEYLKPEFKIVDDALMEYDDEFSVEAPPEWNVEQLSVGDTIDPNMWDKNKTMGVKHTDIEFDETYKIFKIKDLGDWWDVDQEGFVVYEVELLDSQGVVTIDYLDNINMWLKPEFKVVKTMMESDDDEFSVEAPIEWNVTDLEIGDYIYPNMINVPKDKRKWNHYHNILADPKRIDGWQITGFKQNNGRDLVHLEYNGVGNFFDVDQLNKILKQYKIFFPTNETKLSSLLEMEDEFSVEAPPEWNINHFWSNIITYS